MKIGLVFAGSFGYAVMRYVIFNLENLPHLPLFVLNKAVSTAAGLCFVIAFVIRAGAVGEDQRRRAAWLRAGVFGALWHVPMSLSLLRPGYFDEFFQDDGRMTAVGEGVFALGAAAAGLLYLLTRRHLTPRARWALSLAMITAVMLHTATMGVARGIRVNAEHGYLPPMWLLSSVAAAVGVGSLTIRGFDAMRSLR